MFDKAAFLYESGYETVNCHHPDKWIYI